MNYSSVCILLSGIPVVDQGGLEKESTHLFRVALKMDANMSVLNLVVVKKKKRGGGERYSWSR